MPRDLFQKPNHAGQMNYAPRANIDDGAIDGLRDQASIDLHDAPDVGEITKQVEIADVDARGTTHEVVHELWNEEVGRVLARPCVVERAGHQDAQATREGTRNLLHRALAFRIGPARRQRMIFGNWSIFLWRRIDCRAARKNDASWGF